MGYVLLGVENLTVTILLVATLVACLAHWRLTLSRSLLAGFLALVILAAYAGLTATLGFLEFKMWLGTHWFYPLLMLTVCYAAGAGWLVFVGLRRDPTGLPSARAAGWSRTKLAIALGVAVALHLATIWNLDLAVRQRLGTLRAESGALALSVAPARVPDHDNAALIYQRAFEALGVTTTKNATYQEAWPKEFSEKWSKWIGAGATGFDAKDAQLRAYLKQHAGALALLREGGAKPGCHFGRDYGRPSLEMVLPDIGVLRNCARLLALDARCKAADGDVRGALRDCRAILAMAEHMSTDPILVALLVSIAMDDLAMQTLEATLAASAASAEDLAVVNVDENLSFARAYLRDLRMEEAFGMATFCDLGMRPDFACAEFGVRWSEPLATVYRLFLLDDDVESYRQIMKKCQGLAAQPFPQATSNWEDLDNVGKNGRPKGVLTGMLVPAMFRCAQKAASGDACHRLMQSGLAVYRYRASRGSLPDKLDQLTPDFLPTVPQDPFDGKPLRMKKTDGGMVLYSIGPDGIDGGGAVFDSEKKTGDVTFTVRKSAR